MTNEEKKAIEELKVLIGLEVFNKLSYKENQPIKIVLNLIETQSKEIEELKKKNQNVSDRIEYYLVGNMKLDDFDIRNEELRKIEKMLEDK